MFVKTIPGIIIGCITALAVINILGIKDSTTQKIPYNKLTILTFGGIIGYLSSNVIIRYVFLQPFPVIKINF